MHRSSSVSLNAMRHSNLRPLPFFLVARVGAYHHPHETSFDRLSPSWTCSTYHTPDSSLGSYASPSLCAPSSTSCSTLHTLWHHPHISLLPCRRCLYPIRQPLTTHLYPSRPITCARESQDFYAPDFSPQGPFFNHCSCLNRFQLYRRRCFSLMMQQQF
jgi:hypothetical protein